MRPDVFGPVMSRAVIRANAAVIADAVRDDRLFMRMVLIESAGYNLMIALDFFKSSYRNSNIIDFSPYDIEVVV